MPMPPSARHPPAGTAPTRGRRALLLAAGWLAALWSPTTRSASPDAAAPRPQVWGYYPWWLRDQWRVRELSLYDRWMFFEIEIDGDGQLTQRHGWPQRFEALLATARTRGLPLEATATMFDASRFERVFTHPERRQRLVAELLRLTTGPQAAQGIHLDIEIFDRVSPAAVDGYRAFVADLRAGLNLLPTPARSLTAFGVMGGVVDLYDAATLQRLDQIVLQGYDSHHLESRRTGPVAPLRGPYAITWQTTLAHYLRLGATRQKILFGVPFFGYEWPSESATPGARTLGRGREMTYALLDARLLPNIRIGARAQAEIHGLRRDPASGSPFYAYRDATGIWRQGWFEDEQSLGEKLDFVREQRLAGVAVFPVGYDDGAFDNLLRRSVRGR
jgi:spore germination protein YaaH